MNLYDLGLDIFKERRFINYKKTLPLYLCSIACHVFNLENKTRKDICGALQISEGLYTVFR